MEDRTRYRGVLLVVVAALLIFSCEDEISPKLENAEPIAVIDAWLTNNPGNQIIKITSTQSYFDNTLPQGISGANVTVTDDLGAVYLFQEDPTAVGDYVWSPVGSEVFGGIDRQFRLEVLVGAESFIAFSKMNRVPVIDSLTFTFEEANAFLPESYLAR